MKKVERWKDAFIGLMMYYIAFIWPKHLCSLNHLCKLLLFEKNLLYVLLWKAMLYQNNVFVFDSKFLSLFQFTQNFVDLRKIFYFNRHFTRIFLLTIML